MNIKNIIHLARLEWWEHKRRILGSIPVLLFISILGFVLSVIRASGSDWELVGRNIEAYRQLYPCLLPGELRPVILSDFKLTMIVLTAALVSPFLGILDSIGSEKERRTIESLLVMPLSDAEIITGKMVTCLLAGILLAWLLWMVHFIFLTFYSSSAVALHLLSPAWLILCFLLVPAVALFMNLIGIIIAVLVQKAQTGYNLGLVVLFPLAVILTMLGLGAWQLTVKNLVSGFILFVLLDTCLFNLAYKVFNREKIILKYK
jgi:ABC-2 type transport system permease protein